MAKGASSKEIVKNKILEIFEGSFVNDKEIRIPLIENGENLEIKVTLTCAKDVIGGGSAPVKIEATPTAFPTSQPASAAPVEVSAEEKERLKNILANLF